MSIQSNSRIILIAAGDAEDRMLTIASREAGLADNLYWFGLVELPSFGVAG